MVNSQILISIRTYYKLERKRWKKANHFLRQNNLETRLNDKVINRHLDFLNEINCKTLGECFIKAIR